MYDTPSMVKSENRETRAEMIWRRKNVREVFGKETPLLQVATYIYVKRATSLLSQRARCSSGNEPPRNARAAPKRTSVWRRRQRQQREPCRQRVTLPHAQRLRGRIFSMKRDANNSSLLLVV